ncbi:MAG: hypothetical protein QOJ30_5530, partial [Pseudonocardiales bacterium]|nr:hypothetical protein [Pseudonocardiales bacterium]
MATLILVTATSVPSTSETLRELGSALRRWSAGGAGSIGV